MQIDTHLFKIGSKNILGAMVAEKIFHCQL